MEKREPLYTVGGNVNWYSHYSKRYMHPSVHCSTIYNSQDMEATYMSINRGMAKEDVVHIYDEILLSYKKGKKLCHLQRCGWTERLTQSDISQKDKNKNCII